MTVAAPAFDTALTIDSDKALNTFEPVGFTISFSCIKILASMTFYHVDYEQYKRIAPLFLSTIYPVSYPVIWVVWPGATEFQEFRIWY